MHGPDSPLDGIITVSHVCGACQALREAIGRSGPMVILGILDSIDKQRRNRASNNLMLHKKS